MQITRAKRTALILLSLCLLLALTACGGEVSPIEKGDRYRDFTGELADGGTFRLSDHEGKVILLNFWATWCGPCVGMAPIIDKLAEEFEGRVVVGKYNVDEEGDLSTEYRIMSLPTILFFKDGKKTDIRLAGSQKEEVLRAKIEELLAK